MEGKQGAILTNNVPEAIAEISDMERAYYEATRIRKELDGLIQFIAARLPRRARRSNGPAEAIDPRTGKPFNKRR